jgi:exopolyphosphatase/pppGpp-phosphohydrolase
MARIEKYRVKMVGPESLWHIWRVALPSGEQAEAAALKRLKLWASFVDPDVRHSAQVTRLGLQLYDELPARSENGMETGHSLRTILELACLLHNVGTGKAQDKDKDTDKKDKQKHRKPVRLIRKLKPPLGWTTAEMLFVSVVVRYHQGGLPRTGQKALARLTLSQRRETARLAGILRVADAFDVERDGRIQRLRVRSENGVLVVEALGYSPRDRMAQTLASARHLLETVYRRPILVKPMRIQRKAPRLAAPRAA